MRKGTITTSVHDYVALASVLRSNDHRSRGASPLLPARVSGMRTCLHPGKGSWAAVSTAGAPFVLDMAYYGARSEQRGSVFCPCTLLAMRCAL